MIMNRTYTIIIISFKNPHHEKVNSVQGQPFV